MRSGLDLEVSYSATGERLVRRYQSAGAALAEAASRPTADHFLLFPRQPELNGVLVALVRGW